MNSVSFIGGGKMAEAIVGGIIRAEWISADHICVCEPLAERRDALAASYGVRVSADNADALQASVIVFAVKPQQLETVLCSLAASLDATRLCVSIAAGKRTAWIEAHLAGVRVVRVMPNLNCLVGEALSALCPGSLTNEKDIETVREMFSCCGRVIELPESQFDAVTALSGSGPAFMAFLLDAFVRGAEAEGMCRKDALFVGTQTMLGTAAYIMKEGVDPCDLITAVTSEKGTTAEGRAVLETSGVSATLIRTIAAAARRSRELCG